MFLRFAPVNPLPNSAVNRFDNSAKIGTQCVLNSARSVFVFSASLLPSFLNWVGHLVGISDFFYYRQFLEIVIVIGKAPAQVVVSAIYKDSAT